MQLFLNEKAELTELGRKVTWTLVGLYVLAICYMCFGPQHTIDGVDTPNIQYFGRVVVLLVPFNTLVSLSELRTPLELIVVIGQNLVNIFLLFPLLLGMLALLPKLRSWKSILNLAFCLSLFIECTQVVLDLLSNANRVFEIDDLWTNTLGGAVAFLCYNWLKKVLTKYLQK